MQLILSLVLFFPSSSFALSIPDRPASYVNDYASLLSQATRDRLEATLAAFDEETSTQVFVAVFPGLEGEVLEDFSIRLAEKWKAGTKKNDNGVLLLVFRDDRAVRIEVGYGLEGALPDALAGQIIQNEIVPSFRAGDHDGGVSKGVAAILAATRGEYKAEPPTDWDMITGWTVTAFLFYLFLPVLGYGLLLIGAAALWGSSGFAGGVGAVLLLEYLRRRFFPDLWRETFRHGGTTYSSGRGSGGGGFAGGGFGGGGGGSFGGGGASGRW